MILSQIDNVKPEQKLNSEPQPNISTSPPAIGNTNVIGCLSVRPISLREANAFVLKHHRHHKPVVGAKFSIGVFSSDELKGVAICGRPVGRKLDDGFTLEVNRLCLMPSIKNGCSKLYSACWKIAKAMGYKKIITYILMSETGVSLKASGWILEAENVGGTSWNSSGSINQNTSKITFLKLKIMKQERFEITRGVHCLDIFYQSIRKGHRDVFIRCADDDSCTQDIYGEWIEEHSSACYMPSVELIDKIITKLQEAKKYLQGEPIEIEDGFGGIWSNVCPNCEEERMCVVRPGKVACSKCG